MNNPGNYDDEPMRLTGGQRALWTALMAVIKTAPHPDKAANTARNAVERMVVDELNLSNQQPRAWIDGLIDMQRQIESSLEAEYPKDG